VSKLLQPPGYKKRGGSSFKASSKGDTGPRKGSLESPYLRRGEKINSKGREVSLVSLVCSFFLGIIPLMGASSMGVRAGGGSRHFAREVNP